jgi:outer membrane protein OmpA-like peptidoglycan-associated protein
MSLKPGYCLIPRAWREGAGRFMGRVLIPLKIALFATAPLLAQDLQVGLDRQAPRALQINPPGGTLRLGSGASVAPAFRLGWDIWRPREQQALEVTAGLRLPSERQLTFANSVGASGDVQARLKLDTQFAVGALYRFGHPFELPLEVGLGLEERRERLVLKDGGLASAGSLNRPWFRAVLRHRFETEAFGPFVALEWARPLTSAPTPSGVDYLLDLDQLGSSPNPGTAAMAHAPTYSLTLAVGYRFGGHWPKAQVVPVIPAPEPLETLPVAIPAEVLPKLPAPAILEPTPVPARLEPPVQPETPTQPDVIVLDEAALHFALNRAEIPTQGLDLLRAWAARLKGLAQGPVLTVLGYSDATGRRTRNLRLSLRRAQAVAEVLRDEGLVVSRVEGLGPDQPIASNENLEGRARNRRVEIHLEGVPSSGRTTSDLVPEDPTPRNTPKKRP